MSIPLADPGGVGPNSFLFAYIFAEKCPCRGPRPLREILDPPLNTIQPRQSQTEIIMPINGEIHTDGNLCNVIWLSP